MAGRTGKGTQALTHDVTALAYSYVRSPERHERPLIAGMQANNERVPTPSR